MKKGFTLVEVLGVIIVLSLILLISVPAVARYIKDSREDAYELQIKTMEEALESYATNDRNLLPKSENEITAITLGQLKAEGLIKNDISDPENDNLFEDSIELTIRKNGNNYIYKVTETTISVRTTKDKSPTIQLIGDIVQYYSIGDTYTEAGYSAYDYDGNKITEVTVDDSSVRMEMAGIYKISYEATDDKGIKTYAIRNIIVR